MRSIKTLAALAFTVTTGQAKLEDKINKRLDFYAGHFKSIFDDISDTADELMGSVQSQVDDLAEQVDEYVDEHQDEIHDIREWADAMKNLPDTVKDVADNTNLAVDFFDSLADMHELDFLPVKNTTCITLHCSADIAACLAAGDCRGNLECEAACPAHDFFCQFTCTQSYPSNAFDTMFSCLFVEHGCLWLPPPEPINNATCRDHTPVAEIDEAGLEGTWYVVSGFNPVYDCFACQMETFTVKDGQVSYTANFNMAATNGTEIWPSAEMSGNITGGVVELYGFDHGLPDHQSWNVMYQTEDTLVTYYCGDVLDQWHFEGLIVMSKTTSLNMERMDDIRAVLASLDISEDEMCQLSPANDCPAAIPAITFTQ